MSTQGRIFGESQGEATETRYIEVKGKEYSRDDWGIGLTRIQYVAAQEYGDSYYLYVVEYTADPIRTTLCTFHDPANAIAEYCFDTNWKAFADVVHPSTVPAP